MAICVRWGICRFEKWEKSWKGCSWIGTGGLRSEWWFWGDGVGIWIAFVHAFGCGMDGV